MQSRTLISVAIVVAALVTLTPQVVAQNYGYLGMKNYVTARVEFQPIFRTWEEDGPFGNESTQTVDLMMYSFGIGRMLSKRTALQLNYGRTSANSTGRVAEDFVGFATFDYDIPITSLSGELKVSFKGMGGPIGLFYSLNYAYAYTEETTVALRGDFNTEQTQPSVSYSSFGIGGGTRYVIADRLLLELGVTFSIPLSSGEVSGPLYDIGQPFRSYTQGTIYRPFLGLSVMF